MHDLFGGVTSKVLSNKFLKNYLFKDVVHDLGAPGAKAFRTQKQALRSYNFFQKNNLDLVKPGQALTDANIAFSKELLETSAVKNMRNWMIGGAAYGGVTGANNGRRNGQGMVKGGIGGALRGGAMGFGVNRGYAMFGHKIPQGWKNSAGSWRPFNR